mgnify:CR=1 FL=1
MRQFIIDNKFELDSEVTLLLCLLYLVNLSFIKIVLPKDSPIIPSHISCIGIFLGNGSAFSKIFLLIFKSFILKLVSKLFDQFILAGNDAYKEYYFIKNKRNICRERIKIVLLCPIIPQRVR